MAHVLCAKIHLIGEGLFACVLETKKGIKKSHKDMNGNQPMVPNQLQRSVISRPFTV